MDEGSVHSEPPPLPYSLHTRKKAIAIFWTIFVVDTLAQPLVLYWALWYATDLSHNLGMPTLSPCEHAPANSRLRPLVFSIVTACLGGVSVFEYFYRLYNLFRKGSRARPLNARKSRVGRIPHNHPTCPIDMSRQLDFFHINFTIVWLILAVELIV